MTYRIACGAMIAALLLGVWAAWQPADSSSSAPVAATSNTLPTAGDAAASAPYTVDIAHSTLIFRIRHFGVAYFFGRINQPSGEFIVDDSDLANSYINITIAMKDLDAGNQSRDRFLMGPDFFNVREFPEATFKSASISKLADGTYEAVGDFTMRGVSKRITIPIEEYTTKQLERFGQRAGFLCTFTIKRSEFGMDKMVQEGTLGDEVQITAGIEGVVQQ